MPAKKKSRLKLPSEKSISIVLAVSLAVIMGVLIFKEVKQEPELSEPVVTEQPG